MRRGHPYVYESTLTLQRISSLLTDGEDQNRDEEGKDKGSRTTSLTDALLNFPEQTGTQGPTDPILSSNLKKDTLVELVLFSEGKLCFRLCKLTIHT